ncbi:MAG: penicillin-binding protein 2 [Anaerolineae bacterium]|nr:penicillin-binding protein 2 [Anaerolineae bacterium]
MTSAKRHLIACLIVCLSLTLAGCSLGPGATATPIPTPTPNLPPADEVAFAFLQAWERSDYPVMYSLLSPAAQQKYGEDQFTATYQQVADEAALLNVTPNILAAYQPGTHAEISFATSFSSALAGDFEIHNQMALSYVEGRWGIDWSPSLIFPQLSDDTFIHMTTRVPARGNIYDRNGLGLAVQGDLVEIGVVPGWIQDEAALLAQLSAILGRTTADLQALYAGAPADWYMPLGQINAATAQAYYQTLTSLPGIELREAWTRSYRPEIIAPHIVGVVGPIPKEEAEVWRAQGYAGDELVGRMGLEMWGEPYLSGERGGQLEIITNKGQQIAILATKPSRESLSLYTTFDREFQKKVQDILGRRLGAIAVLEAKTGRILALATYPSFDPNLFTSGISDRQWQILQADSRRPLVNRATQGTYPPGSVFKIITMSTAMEKGGLTRDSTFTCQGTWTGLGPDWPKTCWLRTGHGQIRLDKALTVSCDITFYQVALLLNGIDQNLLPDYARRFGLGQLTGIEVEENPGLVPDPAWKLQAKGEGWAPGDTVNLGIGQSEIQATPLQLAVMLAAVGNGGTLYRPQVVEMIAADPARPDLTFQPAALGQLPVSADNLAVIQDSLAKVALAEYGTAYDAFKGLSLPVAGKTGTAESGQNLPHAWFAGYAPADDPEIAIAIVVKNSGEGAKYAAPLFRQVVEAYFAALIQPTPVP